jgi:TPR repeat protein
MEWLDGEDLRDRLARAPLTLAESVTLGRRVAEALAAVHAHGLVHRDIKPGNLFLARDHKGRTVLKIMDFGIAKVLEQAPAKTATAIGTPAYAAPEQMGPTFRQLAASKGTTIASTISPATDVWPLGLIAYELLTGLPPAQFWGAETLAELPLKVTIEDPAPPSARAGDRATLLPAGFDGWFARTTQKDAAQRWPSAGEAAAAFAALVGPPSTAPSAGPSSGGLPPPTAPVSSQRLPEGSGPAWTGPPQAQQIPYGAAPGTPAYAMTPVGPHAPQRPAAPSRSSGPPFAILGAVALAILGAGGFAVRAYLRAHQVSECEARQGEDLAAACAAACASEPKKFCVAHGDVMRAKLTSASLEEASRSYEKACDAEDFVGCMKLGAIEARQNNHAAALAHFTRSCDGHDPGGCARLGQALARGRGVARDAARASTLLDGACRDDAASCAFLAFDSQDRPGPRPEPAEIAALGTRAAPALEKECATGGLDECLALGFLHQEGEGVRRDPASAAKLFHKACQGGLAEACNDEAALELLGPDPGKNVARAADALRTACSAGTTAACNNLAVLEADVPFTLRQEQGVSLFELACGDPILVGCTENGEIVRTLPGRHKDVPEAITLLKKACSDGLGLACANMGSLHENGYGVAESRAEARSAYEKACASGARDGCVTMKGSPFQKGETWAGTYTCAQGLTDVSFRILEPGPGQRTNAIFDFDYGKGQVPGRFLMSGDLDPQTGAIAFTPGVWIERPPGWVTVALHGKVSAQGTIFAGTIDTRPCGAIRVVRTVSDVVAHHCPDGARFVEGHGCVPVPNPGATALGTWTGRSSGAAPTWLVNATISSLESGRCGHVTYPDLACTGEWYCTKSTDGKTLRARELINPPTGRCEPTTVVDITVADDNQSGEWRWSVPGKARVDTARLTRAAP